MLLEAVELFPVKDRSFSEKGHPPKPGSHPLANYSSKIVISFLDKLCGGLYPQRITSWEVLCNVGKPATCILFSKIVIWLSLFIAGILYCYPIKGHKVLSCSTFRQWSLAAKTLPPAIWPWLTFIENFTIYLIHVTLYYILILILLILRQNNNCHLVFF